MQSKYINWLFSEAGAGWVFGVVSLIALLVSFIKRKTQRIVFNEIARQSLVSISKSVREKVSISFDDVPVERLSQLKAELINTGSKVIRNATVTIEVPQALTLLDVSFQGEFGKKVAKIEIKDKKVSLTLPYLNPIKPHSHKVLISILLDGRLKDLKVYGSGEGWSVRHSTVQKTLVRQLTLLTVIMLLGFGLSLTYVFFMEYISGIGRSEVSWRAFRFALPAFILLIAVGVWAFRRTRRIIRLMTYQDS
jgi:hypothetical protein